MRSFSLPSPLLRAVVPAAVLAVLGVHSSSAPAHQVLYTGKATGIEATANILTTKVKLLLVNVPFDCLGRPKEEVLASVGNPGPLKISSKSVRGYTLGDNANEKATALASIEDTTLEVPGLKVQVQAIDARAEASCDGTKTTVDGESTLAGLMINGKTVQANGQPNQKFEVPGVASITINEQVRLGREISVYGLHIKLLDDDEAVNGDIYMAKTRARIQCLE